MLSLNVICPVLLLAIQFLTSYMLSVRNTFCHCVYDPISGPTFRFSSSCMQTSCYQHLTSITPALKEKNTWAYHISTIV